MKLNFAYFFVKSRTHCLILRLVIVNGTCAATKINRLASVTGGGLVSSQLLISLRYMGLMCNHVCHFSWCVFLTFWPGPADSWNKCWGLRCTETLKNCRGAENCWWLQVKVRSHDTSIRRILASSLIDFNQGRTTARLSVISERLWQVRVCFSHLNLPVQPIETLMHEVLYNLTLADHQASECRAVFVEWWANVTAP